MKNNPSAKGVSQSSLVRNESAKVLASSSTTLRNYYNQHEVSNPKHKSKASEAVESLNYVAKSPNTASGLSNLSKQLGRNFYTMDSI